jgi:hypothetical protein
MEINNHGKLTGRASDRAEAETVEGDARKEGRGRREEQRYGRRMTKKM